MLFMGVTILEHDDIYLYSIAGQKRELNMFRSKEEGNKTRDTFH